MKNILVLGFFILFLFFDKDISKQVYPKYPIYAFVNDGDLKKEGKELNNVKDKIVLEIGQKFDAIKEKKSGDKTYYQIQMPDKKKYWADAAALTEKYVTINANDVICYTQPSKDFMNSNFKLQPGDFGYFVKEQDGFINADFYISVPRGKDNKVVWIGNVWLNGGYTNEPKQAKEGYWLYLAYNQIYAQKPNIDLAKKYLKSAIDANNDDKTEVADVAKKVLEGLK